MSEVAILGMFTIIATLLGPILAVQAQKYLERGRDRRNEKVRLFKVLMATRAMKGASIDHIQALNLIQVTFVNNSERSIVSLWRRYFDFLCQSVPNTADSHVHIQWAESANQHLTSLLMEIGNHLGFQNLDEVELKRGAYHPMGQQEEGFARVSALKNFAKLTAGDAFPMNVTGFPVSEVAMRKQLELWDIAIAALSGASPLRVRLDNSSADGHENS